MKLIALTAVLFALNPKLTADSPSKVISSPLVAIGGKRISVESPRNWRISRWSPDQAWKTVEYQFTLTDSRTSAEVGVQILNYPARRAEKKGMLHGERMRTSGGLPLTLQEVSYGQHRAGKLVEWRGAIRLKGYDRVFVIVAVTEETNTTLAREAIAEMYRSFRVVPAQSV